MLNHGHFFVEQLFCESNPQDCWVCLLTLWYSGDKQILVFEALEKKVFVNVLAYLFITLNTESIAFPYICWMVVWWHMASTHRKKVLVWEFANRLFGFSSSGSPVPSPATVQKKSRALNWILSFILILLCTER